MIHDPFDLSFAAAQPEDDQPQDSTPSPASGPPAEEVPEKPAEPEQRSIQRRAMSDLVQLSVDCSNQEAAMESGHDTAVADAAKKHEWGKSDLTGKLEKLKADIQGKYEGRLKELTGQHATETNSATSTDKKTRQKIEADFNSINNDVKQKTQQAVWLAESVFEAAQIQLRTDLKQAKEDFATHIQQVDEFDAQAAQLMVNFGQKLPPESEGETKLPEGANAAELFANDRTEIEELLSNFRRLKLPGWFTGIKPFAILVLAVVIAAVAAQVSVTGMPSSLGDISTIQPAVKQVGIAAGATLVILIVLGVVLKSMANKQIQAIWVPLRSKIDEARAAARQQSDDTKKDIDARLTSATKKRDTEVAAAKQQFVPTLAAAAKKRDAAKQAAAAEIAAAGSRINAQRDKTRAELDAWLTRKGGEYEKLEAQEHANFEDKHRQIAADIEAKYQADKAALAKRWTEGLANIQSNIDAEANHGEKVPLNWSDPAWKTWKTPKTFASAIRFGEMGVDLQQITNQLPKHLELPPQFSVSALLAFPKHSSVLIETDRNGRPEAIRTMQMIMTRLLVSIPAGRLRFTIIDPVGLGQNFSGFMHLSDYDDALVGTKIWTSAEEIDQRLHDLTEHMQTVIQKYLRNEFPTIDDYNAQAGELAEPYRFLVIADFPTNLSAESLARLASIAGTGARCGVYTLILRDLRIPLPHGAHVDDIEHHSVIITRQNDAFVWKDEVFSKFPLKLDPPPGDEELTALLHKVGQGAKEAKRVEVPFDIIAPKPDSLWTEESSGDLHVPIGRMGATRLQMMRLGRGVAQHALIAGKTGSGKSNLLNAIITNLAMWYEPDQIELYLIDFKKGVEFKTYATHNLPHARAIAVESDREFGLSVLQRLDAELVRRGELYRKVGSQDLASYRRSEGALPMPRQLLVIDEFQEFFSEDDRVAQEAQTLLDRLVRQGRAFGIHVLLGSQTIGGSAGLARTTIGQMNVRVALACSEADSQLILGDNNSAARLLSRPGEAIYNDQGGLVEANSPFQIAFLSDEKREVYLERVTAKVRATLKGVVNEPIVFEGNQPAESAKSKLINRLLDAPEYPPYKGVTLAWLGDPVAIKDPTAVSLRRQSGSNVLIVGQQDDAALAIMATAMLGIAAQQKTAKFYVLDGTPADSPFAGTFERIKQIIPNEVKIIDFRAIPEAMIELETEMKTRGEGELGDVPSIYFFVYGLQRYRALRKSEDTFGGFGSSDEEKKPDPGAQFAELLREGPPVGIHTITWCDTPASVERTLDRTLMRELDNRVLFQMSANDSSNLIDSPAANKLGQNRALAYSEEQGVMEKFRPYGMPTAEWMEKIKKSLASRV